MFTDYAFVWLFVAGLALFACIYVLLNLSGFCALSDGSWLEDDVAPYGSDMDDDSYEDDYS